MTAKVYGGLGAVLAYSTTIPGVTYVTVAEVVSIDGPKFSVGGADATNLASTFKVMRPTLADPGTADFVCQYDPADTTHIELLSLGTSTTIVAWKLTLADAAPTSWTFNGYVSACALAGLTAEGNMELHLTLQITSAITT